MNECSENKTAEMWIIGSLTIIIKQKSNLLKEKSMNHN